MITILMVEDDAAVRMLTKANLKNRYRLQFASDGLEALEVMNHEHADLILADIMMPNMDGYELVNELRGRQPGPGDPSDRHEHL